MTVDITKLVGWFDDHKGKLTYSMSGSRNGADGTADCSGSVTQAIYEAGGIKPAYLFSTVTLESYLIANGFERITANKEWNAERGDVVLMSWGADMSTSGGAGGHTGVMKNANTFISTDYTTGGQAGTAVYESNFDNYYNACGARYYEAWRLKKGADQMAAETVFAKDGIWYTDRKFKQRANGIKVHVGIYYYFENGKRVDDAFREAFGYMYYFGKDGKCVQGNVKRGKTTYDFGEDGKYYLRGVKVD